MRLIWYGYDLPPGQQCLTSNQPQSSMHKFLAPNRINIRLHFTRVRPLYPQVLAWSRYCASLPCSMASLILNCIHRCNLEEGGGGPSGVLMIGDIDVGCLQWQNSVRVIWKVLHNNVESVTPDTCHSLLAANGEARWVSLTSTDLILLPLQLNTI